MAHLFDNALDSDERQQFAPPARRPWLWGAGVVAALAIVGIASAFAWRTYGGVPLTLPSFTLGTEQQPAAPAVAVDKPVGLKDLQALQQQIAGPLQSSAQLLAAQQVEIKRLSEQVSALAAKVDALEHPSASAQTSLPASAAPAAPPAPALRKKPAAPKTPAGISVGGAPLPPGQSAR